MFDPPRRPRSAVGSSLPRSWRLGAVVLLAAGVSGFALRPAAPLSPRFNHVMLYVSDLEASIGFYVEAFGVEVGQRVDTLTVVGDDGTETVRPVRMAFLRFPGQDFVFELSEQPAGPAPAAGGADRWFQHVGVDVTDIEAAAARVQAAGGREFSGIRTVRASGGTVARNAFFRGPDGERVELMQVLAGEF